MKHIVFACLATFIAISLQAQVAKPEKAFVIKTKDIWSKADEYRDSIKIEDNKSFKIVLDTTGKPQGVSISSVMLQEPGDRREVTNDLAVEEYSLGKDSAYTFTILAVKQMKVKKDTSYPMVKITYHEPKSTVLHDTLVYKEKLAEALLSLGSKYNFDAQKDTIVTKEVAVIVNEDQKKVHFIFYRKAEPKTGLEAQVEQMSNRLEDLFKSQGEKQAIGYFTLKDAKIPVFKRVKSEEKNWLGHPKSTFVKDGHLQIKRVTIDLTNGSVSKRGVMVETTDGRIFRNNKAPISVYRLNKRTSDRLFSQDKRDSISIEVGDVFSYNYSGKFHYPDQDSVSLTSTRMVDSIYNFSSINDLLNVSIYTDLLGLLGRRPNGILQTEISGNFITNTRNWSNHDFIPVNFVRPYFRLSKFDSRFAQVDTNVIKNDVMINRLYLNQISYLQAGIKLNMFRIGWGPNQHFLVNVGADVNLTNADSLFKKDITSVNYYPEVEYRVNGLENFGMEVSLKWIHQAVSKNSPFNNRESIWIFNPSATVYYHPFNKPQNRIYLRYSNFAEIDGGKYNFSQFQFGFKTNLFKKDND